MSDILYSENFLSNDLIKNPVEKLILKYVKQQPILDVGCGNGNLMKVLSNYDIEGVDPCELAVSRAKEKELKVYHSNISNFNSSIKYKTILLIGVLAQLENPEEDFKKVLTWLHEEGELIIVHPNSSSPFFKRHESHRWLLKLKDFERFLNENDLNIEIEIGAGRLRCFPMLSSINFYLLKWKKR